MLEMILSGVIENIQTKEASMTRKNKESIGSKALKLVEQATLFDTRVAAIQMLIPIGLKAVEEELQAEVKILAGEKHSREGLCYRWGRNPGSVYLGDQKVQLAVPRLRDCESGKEKVLESYGALQNPKHMTDQVLVRILSGMSQRRYEEAVIRTADSFGLSKSSVNRKFIRASARRLEEMLNRDLRGYDIVAIFMDGKRFAEMDMVVALGVTLTGEKVILGFIESATENSKVVAEFLNNLKDRGLKTDSEILFIVDGSKGMLAAIEKVFGETGIVQRCQWHKMENVLSYLPDRHQENIKAKLKAAYHSSSYEEAEKKLVSLQKEIRLINESAAKSLAEGMAETLTLHRLGLFNELGTSFKTTNCIESVFSIVGQYTDKVDCWKNSNQRQRWLASSLIRIEKDLRKVKGYKYLPLLRQAMKREFLKKQKMCA